MNTGEGDERAAHGAAAEVARRSYGKLVALVAASTRDVAAAEDALSEAFAAALSDWPRSGCPDSPEAWLLTVARRKLIDIARGLHREQQAAEQIASSQLQAMAEVLDTATPGAAIPDRRLSLLFACAHPSIEVAIRAPLMLQTVLGLDAERIASAFLMSPAAMGKRLVRAKSKIRQAGIPFTIPERDELAGRLEAVLDAIYAAFTEGWSDPNGTDAVRRELTADALFLARLVSELLPDEPEALGLLALMLHAEARRRTRRSADGEYVPLSEQDPAAWDAAMIDEAEALIRRAGARGLVGRYKLEAALQSAHVWRCRTGESNWGEIVQLYDALLALTGSPVVLVNRALAIAHRDGEQRGLEELDQAAACGRLAEYQPYWAARAELLAKTGARDAARQAYEMAIGLERDPAVRRFLLRKKADHE